MSDAVRTIIRLSRKDLGSRNRNLLPVLTSGKMRERIRIERKMSLGTQVVWLFVMAIPIACIAWTVTHEEVLREPRDYCLEQSQHAHGFLRRKFFYLFTCEYCFSHYVAAFFVGITRYKLLYQDWRGYIIGGFALVWIANQYISLYNHLRLDLKKERAEISKEQKEVEIRKAQAEAVERRNRPAA